MNYIQIPGAKPPRGAGRMVDFGKGLSVSDEVIEEPSLEGSLKQGLN